MSDRYTLDEAHRALLAAALAAASPRGARVALDLACGAGGKTPWLAGCCAPGALVLGLDADRGALALARAGDPARPWLAGDALRLPVRPRSLDLIWCVAALGLFADQAMALREAAAALAPGGTMVVATAGERWVRPRRWTPGAAAVPGAAAPLPADGLGDELREGLERAGLAGAGLAAYLLEPPGLAPREALLPLAELAGVTPQDIGEPEVLPVLLVATGRAPLRRAPVLGYNAPTQQACGGGNGEQ